MHNNIDKNKQIRKYYLHIVIFADFNVFLCSQHVAVLFLRQQRQQLFVVCFYDNRDNSDNL